MSIRSDPSREAGHARVLVLAARDDHAAGRMAGHLGRAAVAVGPQDLSRPGWTYARDLNLRTGVSRDGPFRAADLTAVISRIPSVQPCHLPHVRPGDREYVAAETTAFLRAWLTGLPCPVVNPPTATCLSGPALTTPEWVVLCAGLSIPAQPTRLTIPAVPDDWPAPSANRVTVCHGTATATGPCSALLLEHGRRLADQLSVEWLCVTFDGGHDQAAVCQIQTWPDLADPGTREALVQALIDSGAGP